MPCSAPASLRTKIALFALAAFIGAEAHAIEMFTFFGDGSRIGLPSLEVPIEAYPGIPLRRDRMRSRRRSMRSIPPTTTSPAGPARAITIRTMPPPVMPDSPVVEAPAMEPTASAMYRKTPRVPDASDELPVPPEPVAMPMPPSP